MKVTAAIGDKKYFDIFFNSTDGNRRKLITAILSGEY